MTPTYRTAIFALVSTLAACAAQSSDDGSDGSNEALIADYSTPDPANPWTKGVDLANYAIGQENVLPNEDAIFSGFADSIQNMQERLASVNGGKSRGFHAKAHACVQGEVRINVPDSLGARAKQGVFAQNQNYPAWVRYSNGTGFVQPDKSGDVRGVAIKITKVPGDKVWAAHKDALTQDYLFTNGAITPAPDSAQFVEFGKALTDARVGPNGESKNMIQQLLGTGGWLLQPANKRTREYLLSKALPRVLTKGSVLGEQFWTGGAFAMGIADGGDPMHAPAQQAAKMTAVAGVFQNNKCVPMNELPNLFDDNYLRSDLKSRMKNTDTCLDLRIQFQKDASRQPIEDTSVEWKESDSPFVSIGYVFIPKVDLDSASSSLSEAFCNSLTYTPWHALPANRPLGNIMRARLPVYDCSATGRGAAAEPTGDEFAQGSSN